MANDIDVNADTNPYVKAAQEYMDGKRDSQTPTDEELQSQENK